MIYLFLVLNLLINLFILFLVFKNTKACIDSINYQYPSVEYNDDKIVTDKEAAFINVKYDGEWNKIEIKDGDEDVEVITNEQERRAERKLRGY